MLLLVPATITILLYADKKIKSFSYRINGKAGKTLTTTNEIGTRFKIKWVVEKNEVMSYYNNHLVERY